MLRRGRCAHCTEGLVRAGGTWQAPNVVLAYHGTPSFNTDAIMSNGFCPRCRRSAGDGAYFSGELSYSVRKKKEEEKFN